MRSKSSYFKMFQCNSKQTNIGTRVHTLSVMNNIIISKGNLSIPERIEHKNVYIKYIYL